MKFNILEDTDQRTIWPNYPCSKTVDGMLKKSNDILELHKHLFSGFQLTTHNLLDKRFVQSYTFHFGKIDPMVHQDEEHVDVNQAWVSIGAVFKTDHASLSGKFNTKGITNGMFSYRNNKIHCIGKGNYGKKPYFETDIAVNVYGSIWGEAKLSNTAVGLGFTAPLLPSFSFGSELLISPVSKLSTWKFLFQKRFKDSEGNSKFTGLIKTDHNFKIELHYSKKVKKLNILSAIKINQTKDKWTSNWYLGYSYKSKISQIRAMIENLQGTSSIVEIPIAGFLSFQISSKINYVHNVYDFGFGVCYNI